MLQVYTELEIKKIGGKKQSEEDEPTYKSTCCVSLSRASSCQKTQDLHAVDMLCVQK